MYCAWVSEHLQSYVYYPPLLHPLLSSLFPLLLPFLLTAAWDQIWGVLTLPSGLGEAWLLNAGKSAHSVNCNLSTAIVLLYIVLLAINEVLICFVECFIHDKHLWKFMTFIKRFPCMLKACLTYTHLKMCMQHTWFCHPLCFSTYVIPLDRHIIGSFEDNLSSQSLDFSKNLVFQNNCLALAQVWDYDYDDYYY